MLSWPPFPISNLEFTVGWSKSLTIVKKVKRWFHKRVIDQEDPHCQSKSQTRSLPCRTGEGSLATFRSVPASFLHWFLHALALQVNKPLPRGHWSCLPDVNHWLICLKFSQKGRRYDGWGGNSKPDQHLTNQGFLSPWEQTWLALASCVQVKNQQQRW